MGKEPETTAEANRHGYTRQVVIEGEGLGIGFDAFVRPHDDMDAMFAAFDANHQRMVTIDGAKVTVRDNG